MDYEELLKLMRTRRSVREFTERRPGRADVERLIEAARWAPSSHNRQGWKFIVFEDREQMHALSERIRATLTERIKPSPRLPAEEVERMIWYATLFAGAPCVILAMHKRTPAVARELMSGAAVPDLVSGESISTAMAVQNLLLAAHALGLATCVMTAPLLAGELWKELELPPGFLPTVVVAVGYASTEPPVPRRKELDQIVQYR